MKTVPCKHEWRYAPLTVKGSTARFSIGLAGNRYSCPNCGALSIVHDHNVEYWESTKHIPTENRRPR